MKIKSDIREGLKINKYEYLYGYMNEKKYSLSKQDSNGDDPKPVDEKIDLEHLVEQVQCAYLDKAEYEMAGLINDLNQYKTIKYDLEQKIKKDNLSNDDEINNRLRTIVILIQILESLKEEAYMQAMAKTIKDEIVKHIEIEDLKR